ncbi:acylneuraminate cytidylyltransferase family protein [Bowmanella dokdonensis]|uniref:Acylneuraminate cytidylyltransferase family protein n=1 Tax=Bowmanella dokdonensis TaxID=751969 RepID=A0A939IT21_9ALTE|nr:acylneuraminate cytidylyltransferase family protein [Bowmanella dokdonensis]MBN7827026.1 acylneuraminate cytidylyltransferase family protein [Bowmanella dokdonensis]
MSLTAFVPARSGSKRLKGKNIKLLAGKPLVVWTIEACVGAEAVEQVIFSTDSMEYWQIVKKHVPSDKLVLDFRSPEQAGDKVKIFDYVKQQVDKIFQNRSGQFLLALPTMPLRTSKHINEAVALSASRQSPVFSAVEYEAPVSFAFTIGEDDSWTPLQQNSPMVTGNTRSQDQISAYHPNGAIYIRNIDDLREESLKTFYQQAIPYLMPRQDSVDIDTPFDFELAEHLIRAESPGAKYE